MTQFKTKDNVYFKLNKQMFNDLLEFVKKTNKYALCLDAKGRKREANIIPKYKYLKDWIDEVISFYTNPNKMKTTTKVYWILTGLTSFPKCKTCEKDDYYKTYNASINHKYPKYCSPKCIHTAKLVKDKIKETCLKHYGCENPYQSEIIKKKIEQTKLKKYSDKTYRNSNKAKETKLNKTIKDLTYKERIKQKLKETCLKKYGVENSTQCYYIRVKSQQKYMYDNIHFDSAPEIAYYIWLKDHNIQFEYQPNIKLSFLFKNKICYYFPDFKVDNQLIELKGSQFLKENGTWQCVWDHNKDELYETKHQCLIQNNVKILYSKDYQKYLDYIKEKYGKNYLKQFKIKK